MHCGKIIHTEKGKVLTKKTIIVNGNKIEAIENGFIAAESDKDEVIDLKLKTVMPGLIDMHVHIESETSPTAYLEFAEKPRNLLFISVLS